MLRCKCYICHKRYSDFITTVPSAIAQFSVTIKSTFRDAGRRSTTTKPDMVTAAFAQITIDPQELNMLSIRRTKSNAIIQYQMKALMERYQHDMTNANVAKLDSQTKRSKYIRGFVTCRQNATNWNRFSKLLPRFLQTLHGQDWTKHVTKYENKISVDVASQRIHSWNKTVTGKVHVKTRSKHPDFVRYTWSRNFVRAANAARSIIWEWKLYKS